MKENVFTKDNIEELERLNVSYQESDKKREIIIKESRDILKFSKKSIFSIHRNDINTSKDQLQQAKKKIEYLNNIINENNNNKEENLRFGSFSGSLEEYVEAVIFHKYFTKNKIPTLKSKYLQHVNSNEYIGGLIDFTGEITRLAVIKATQRDVEKVKEIKVLIEDIFSSLIQFDFRNGNLRKKYDSVKWNLNKCENLLYDLSLCDVLPKNHNKEDLPPQPSQNDEKNDD
eukprot:TRINITY_DN1008_c0_g1_i2.p1 TRINITY_DN1008_c0_g1~~TRINITY_DN1008_c0_g1_i2.p1  ORF type:complete len:230 (-),score=84.45 TRINITY_DN1008_c0_g1_i2:93-782(-)